jgi:hypothetical protein
VHGGFEGTDTRFSFYFPAKDLYRGRFIQYVYPGHNERTNDPDVKLDGFHGGAGFVGLAAELGAYAVESNDSATAADAGGKDTSVPGYRASAESARFSRYLAAQLYGAAPGFGYVYGAAAAALRRLPVSPTAMCGTERCGRVRRLPASGPSWTRRGTTPTTGSACASPIALSTGGPRSSPRSRELPHRPRPTSTTGE